jgi:hypothetical protein
MNRPAGGDAERFQVEAARGFVEMQVGRFVGLVRRRRPSEPHGGFMAGPEARGLSHGVQTVGSFVSPDNFMRFRSASDASWDAGPFVDDDPKRPPSVSLPYARCWAVKILPRQLRAEWMKCALCLFGEAPSTRIRRIGLVLGIVPSGAVRSRCALRLKVSLLKPKWSPMPGGPTRRADQTSDPQEFRI